MTRFWESSLAGYRMVFNWVVFAPFTRLYVDGYHSFLNVFRYKIETSTYERADQDKRGTSLGGVVVPGTDELLSNKPPRLAGTMSSVEITVAGFVPRSENDCWSPRQFTQLGRGGIT